MRTLLAGRELQISVAALLLATLAGWPYGFYVFLRLAVCVGAVTLAWRASRDGRLWWAVTMGGVAILFNPLLPLHLARPDWTPIDLFAAVAIAICPPVKKSSSATGAPASQPTSITRPRMSSERFKLLASAFWLLFILFPIMAGFLQPHQSRNDYSPNRHEILASHDEDVEEGGRSFSTEVPDKWRDVESGRTFTSKDVASFHRQDAERVALTAFGYGVLGCLFYAYGRHREDKAAFPRAFKLAMLCNAAIAAMFFFICGG